MSALAFDFDQNGQLVPAANIPVPPAPRSESPRLPLEDKRSPLPYPLAPRPTPADLTPTGDM